MSGTCMSSEMGPAQRRRLLLFVVLSAHCLQLSFGQIPSAFPSAEPTAEATFGPTVGPTANASFGPTVGPTAGPTEPTVQPTPEPTPVVCPTGQIANSSGGCENCSVGHYWEDTCGWPGCPSCNPCQPGTYADESGKISCEQCIGPSEYSDGGASSCSVCGPGNYSTDTANCDWCPPGRYGEVVQTSPDCQICGLGTYAANEGATECVDCAPGSYTDTEDSAACRPCIQGQYANQNGTSACKVCEPGRWGDPDLISILTGGAVDCADCPMGRFRGPNSTVCEDCPPGKFLDRTGGSSSRDCKVCPPGRYNANPGSQDCVACNAGRYEDEHGSEDCKSCPVGTFGTQPEAVDIAACIDCLAGQYNDIPASVSCSLCPPGQYSVGRAEICELCPAGTYNEQDGADSVASCIACESGKYSRQEGADASGTCTQCPGLPDRVTTSRAAATFIGDCVCAHGYFLPHGQDRTENCFPCDATSLLCEGNGTGPIAKPGYYFEYMSHAGRDHPVTHTCRVDGGVVCLGGISSSCSGGHSDCPEQCMDGHVGVACAGCANGWSRNKYPEPCERCVGTGVSIFLTSLGWLITAVQYFAIASMQALAAKAEVPPVYTIIIRSMTSWCLTVSHLGSFNLTNLPLIAWSDEVVQARSQAAPADKTRTTQYLQWPAPLEDVLDQLYLWTGNLPEATQVMSAQQMLECWAHDNVKDPQMTAAIYWSFLHAPFIVLASLLLSCCAYQVQSRRMKVARLSKISPATVMVKKSSASLCTTPSVEVVVEKSSAPACTTTVAEASMQTPRSISPSEDVLILGLYKQDSSPLEVLQQTEPVVLVVLYGLWPQMVVRLLGVAACVGFSSPQGLQGRLRQDPNVLCWEGFHWQLIAVSYAGAVIWVVAPLVYIFFRLKFKGTKKFTPDTLARLGYFFTGLEPHYWWWELLIKRLDVFAFVFVAYSPSNAFQDDRAKLMWFTFLSAIALAVNERCAPYDDRQCGLIDFMESMALSTRLMTFLLVSALLLYEASMWLCAASGVAIIVLNIAFVLFSLLHITEDMTCVLQHKVAKARSQVLEYAPGRLGRCAAKFLSCAGGFVQSLARVKEVPAQHVVRIEWKGPGVGIRFISSETTGWRLTFLRWLFRLGDDSQRRFFILAFQEFLSFLTAEVESTSVPSMSIDVYVVLAFAHARLRRQERLCSGQALEDAVVAVLMNKGWEGRSLTTDDFMKLNMSVWQLADDTQEGIVPVVRRVEEHVVRYMFTAASPFQSKSWTEMPD